MEARRLGLVQQVPGVLADLLNVDSGIRVSDEDLRKHIPRLV